MIGIAITTKNRPDLLRQALEHHEKFRPSQARFVVVDDGSDIPVEVPDDWVTLIRHEESLGISAAKNRCIEELMNAGCEDIFLFDDDARPIADDWHIPYINSDQPHLQANYAPAVPQWGSLHEIYRSPELVAHHCGRGHMLYFERRAIDRVGGFDLRFTYGFEHLEVSERCAAAGLTLFPYQDVPGSEQLIHWCDAEATPPSSSIPRIQRRLLNQENLELFERLRGRSTFVPYWPPRDVVLTALFTTTPDPQQGRCWDPDPAPLYPLLQSLWVHGVESVVCYDDPRSAPTSVVFGAWEQVQRGLADPYLQRWATYREYLVAHPEVRWCWCVDGADVTCLQEPFQDMKEGTLYIGYEDEICAKPWMLDHHEASRDWLESHPTHMLLNPGVVGGDRTIIMEFCDLMLRLYGGALTEHKSDRAGDMGYANRVAYRYFWDRMATGPRIVTRFKAYEVNDHSLWAHK